MADRAGGGPPIRRPFEAAASSQPSDAWALSLSALLSHVLVAFTIECDNAFEHRMPHRTTRHGSTPGAVNPVWLVSLVMWVNCMRHVPEEGISAAALTRRAKLTRKTMEIIVRRMGEWWGYLAVERDDGASPSTSPRAAWRVRPTAGGRQAQAVWRPLVAEVEGRWRERIGAPTLGGLRDALEAVVGQLTVDLPEYLPAGDPRLDPASSETGAADPCAMDLPALLSKALLTLALDVHRMSDLNANKSTDSITSRLCLSANMLRVLDERGVRVPEIPALSGIAKMSTDVWLADLERTGYVSVATQSRVRVARLTAKGRRAQEAGARHVDDAEAQWHERYGRAVVGSLRRRLAEVVGAAELDRSPLRLALEPYPDGWRAELARPRTLPHFPAISMRGGFPDGS